MFNKCLCIHLGVYYIIHEALQVMATLLWATIIAFLNVSDTLQTFAQSFTGPCCKFIHLASCWATNTLYLLWEI